MITPLQQNLHCHVYLLKENQLYIRRNPFLQNSENWKHDILLIFNLFPNLHWSLTNIFKSTSTTDGWSLVTGRNQSARVKWLRYNEGNLSIYSQEFLEIFLTMVSPRMGSVVEETERNHIQNHQLLKQLPKFLTLFETIYQILDVLLPFAFAKILEVGSGFDIWDTKSACNFHNCKFKYRMKAMIRLTIHSICVLCYKSIKISNTPQLFPNRFQYSMLWIENPEEPCCSWLLGCLPTQKNVLMRHCQCQAELVISSVESTQKDMALITSPQIFLQIAFNSI